jgi:thioesterase domain-containing protein
VDPIGPYRLAGYSAGGLIAFEMAQQLKRAGAQVVLLAMIDTLCPTVTKRRFSFLRKLWQARHWSIKFAMEWPVRRRKVKLDQAGYGVALEKISNGEPLPPELVDFHLFRNFIAAQDRYEPAPYDGEMILFKAAEAELEFLQGGRSLGWKEHIRGEIRITDIPGSHHSMMAEPGVALLIEGLRKELAMLDESGETRRLGWGGIMLYPSGPSAAG